MNSKVLMKLAMIGAVLNVSSYSLSADMLRFEARSATINGRASYVAKQKPPSCWELEFNTNLARLAYECAAAGCG